MFIEREMPTPIFPARMHLVPKILNERSVEYFERTRAEAYGKSLQELAKTDGGEKAWTEALPGIKALGELLKKEGGPYFMGKTRKSYSSILTNILLIKALASYADFVIVGMLQFYKRIDMAVYERVVKTEPELETLYDACKQWLERDGH